MDQNAPIEDGATDATDDAKLAGLADQMREDIRAGNVHDVASVLRTRLDDAGLQVDEDRFARLLDDIQGV